MIKLKIENPKLPKKPLTNSYKIKIEFMEGDADGTEYKDFIFHESELKDDVFLTELEEFLKCIKKCIALDRKDRGGFENFSDCVEHYGHIKNWRKFVNDEDDEDEDDSNESERDSVIVQRILINKLFRYDMPSDNDGWYSSYRGVELFYYDSVGNELPVNF